MNRYTSTAIAEMICEADGQPLDASVLNRVRHLARSDDLLMGARAIDGRGTKDFPALEVYRARIFLTLFDFAMDARALRDVNVAGSELSHSANARLGKASRGGLIDSIAGVARGERWTLVMAAYPPLEVELPGFCAGEMLYVQFAPEEDSAARDLMRTVDKVRPYGVLRLDLAALYAGLIPIVGVPA